MSGEVTWARGLKNAFRDSTVADLDNYRYKGGRARSGIKPVDVDMGINRHLYDSPKTLIAKGQLVVIRMWEEPR